jgi:hypothetical protein
MVFARVKKGVARMPTIHIRTNELANVTLKKGQDNLDITIASTCNWCFSDPDGVFGNPSALLANGTYYGTIPATTYGLFTPVGTGTVHINAVSFGTQCNPQGMPDTGHTIIVSN